MVLYAVLLISALLPILVYNVVDTAGGSLIVQAKMEKLNSMAFDEPNELTETMNYFKYVMREHNLNTYDLQKGIQCSLPPSKKSKGDSSGILDCSTKAKAAARDLMTWRDFAVNGKMRVVGVSPLNAPESYVDVQMCRDSNGDKEFHGRENQILRLRLGSRAGFRNAISGDHMNCVFCHAQIYGNIVQYKGSITSDMHALEIFGSWLSAGPIPKTGILPVASSQPPKTQTYIPGRSNYINESGDQGGYFKGYETEYEGRAASWDYRKQQKSLPKVDPHSMQAISYGRLQGGRLRVVPIGSVYPSSTSYDGSSVVEGNLIIDGSNSPVTIQGMVFVSGDIVIWGKYQGQGTLVAGGNIYIPNELTAVNLASVLDGTTASNNRLKNVSNAAQAKTIADTHIESDRLLLMATNNVIPGSPFPGSGQLITVPTRFGSRTMWETDKGVGDLRYLINTGMSHFQNELAYERRTGHMVDIFSEELMPVCLGLPWERKEDCLEDSPEFDERFQKTRIDYSLDELMGNEAIYRKIKNKMILPDGYVLNFLPMNIIDTKTGEKRLWISKNNYKSLHKDASDHAVWTGSDGPFGVSKRVIDLTYSPDEQQYPVGIKNKDAWFSEAEKATSFNTKLAPLQVSNHQELAWDPSKKYTVGEMWDRYKSLCQSVTQHETPTPKNSPGFKHVSSFDRPQYSWVTPDDQRICSSQLSQRPEDMFFGPNWLKNSNTNFNGVNHSNAASWVGGNLPNGAGTFQSLSCFFAIKITSASTADVYMDVTASGDVTGKHSCATAAGGPLDSVSGSKWDNCYKELKRKEYKRAEYRGNGTCSIPLRTVYYTNYTYTYSTDKNGNQVTHSHPYTDSYKVCDRYCNRSMTTMNCWNCPDNNSFTYEWENAKVQPASPTEEYHSSVIVNFSPASTGTTVKVASAVINPSYQAELANNLVRRIDAFMLANQFWAYQLDTMTDRAMEVNGGLSSKEMIGRFSNKVGRDRLDTPSRYSYHLWNGGNYLDVSMIMRFDPRFQYTDELIYDNFGSLMFSELSDDLTCE